MAGYSGTPLAAKLGVKAGQRVALLGAPDAVAAEVGRVEPALTRLGGRRPFDVIVLFAGSRAELAKRFGGAAERLGTAGGLWVSWPKKASGVKTDLDEGIVREIGLASGLVDNKVCAIDEVWSGLRFVVRLKDRAERGQAGRESPMPRGRVAR